MGNFRGSVIQAETDKLRGFCGNRFLDSLNKLIPKISRKILPYPGIDPSTMKSMNLSHTGRVGIQDFSLNIQNHDKPLHRLKQSFGRVCQFQESGFLFL